MKKIILITTLLLILTAVGSVTFQAEFQPPYPNDKIKNFAEFLPPFPSATPQ